MVTSLYLDIDCAHFDLIEEKCLDEVRLWYAYSFWAGRLCITLAVRLDGFISADDDDDLGDGATID